MEAIWDTGLVVLGVVLLGILLILVFKRRSKADILRDAARGNIYADVAGDQLESMRKRFTDEQVKEGRRLGARPELAAGYGKPPLRTITFTPRQLERVNIQRRLRGAVPLNKRGFQGAAATAATDTRRPDTTNDWLNYFIFYQLFFADHGSPRTTVDHHFTINPDLPFNGQGGTFGGAGASGAWDAPQAAVDTSAGNLSPAAALGAGAAIGAAAYLADRVPDPVATGDLPSGAAMGAFLKDADPEPAPRSSPMPEPAPAYEAPTRSEPSYSPSPSSDSSSSYSSSSSDSGSSSSGGDSGGGGGGGGGGGD